MGFYNAGDRVSVLCGQERRLLGERAGGSSSRRRSSGFPAWARSSRGASSRSMLMGTIEGCRRRRRRCRRQRAFSAAGLASSSEFRRTAIIRYTRATSRRTSFCSSPVEAQPDAERARALFVARGGLANVHIDPAVSVAGRASEVGGIGARCRLQKGARGAILGFAAKGARRSTLAPIFRRLQLVGQGIRRRSQRRADLEVGVFIRWPGHSRRCPSLGTSPS